MGRLLPALLALSLLAACEPLDRDVFRCEEAMARVLDCCPSVKSSPVACEYGASPLGPHVRTFPKVDCLVGLSCAGLEERGACAWAEAGGKDAVCP
ncbi:MAG: hypothetical protein U0229_08540 [Anaeromyxobacter sp.]